MCLTEIFFAVCHAVFLLVFHRWTSLALGAHRTHVHRAFVVTHGGQLCDAPSGSGKSDLIVVHSNIPKLIFNGTGITTCIFAAPSDHTAILSESCKSKGVSSGSVEHFSAALALASCLHLPQGYPR